ncbi:GNAT family N-acetyltransferase [Paenibacillus albiflavus]|uniref:GNAT family N-acetyltransferase n=1 Tax=Paenibacillus albiflavus TaxID=2545760 RepID=A0A4R4EQJ3_9BACL|nr:GNAT family N-acetyltransferase [Paenibacillus albiflavus]TCZ80881.1 GNAT family N-acetyltransferase [Paenibacillus albiflavus]
MIRRLKQSDHEVCINLLKTRSAENLFIIGDIEAYGYDQEFQKLWGEFNDSGELIAVLLKYQENFIPFAVESFNAEGFAEIISNEPAKFMSGLKEITEKIEPYLYKQFKTKRQTYYAKCTRLTSDKNNVDFSNVQQAFPHDAEALVELRNSVPEFSDSIITIERLRRTLTDGTSRSFFIMEDGKMVSTASTAAENSVSAMVVGVATLENYKKRGHATKCMLKLCSQLLLEGKDLCLFYDNPAAGAIYKRIGFEDIGFWMMYTFRSNKINN